MTAAAASFFPALQAPIHGGNAWRKPATRCKCDRKTYSTFNSLSNSLRSSVSFPINFDSSAQPLRLQPLPDSVQENFTETLDGSMNLQVPMSGIHHVTHGEPCQRIFIRDPPWIGSLFLKGLYKSVEKEVKLEFKEIGKRKYNLLRRRQIKAETEAWEKMAEEYKELEREMCEKKLAPNLPYVKTLFLGWFEPLKQAIEKEQKKQQTKKQKAAFAPHIELLSADKMAVIVMYKMMGLLMVAQQDGCVQVVQAAVQIGGAIEQEVSIEDLVLSFKMIFPIEQLHLELINLL